MRKVTIFGLVICMVITLFTPSMVAEEIPVESRVEKAIEWLVANQDTDGFWGKDLVEVAMDTAEIAGYFKEKSIQTESLKNAIKWLQTLDLNNLDFIARVLPFIEDENRKKDLLETVVSSQNTDGGWGIAVGFESDVLDTVLILNSLLEESEPDINVINMGLNYIIKNQSNIGSWSYVTDGDSSIMLTSEVVLCLSKYISKTNLTSDSIKTALSTAGEFLAQEQHKDGTWGTGKDSITETLTAYMAMIKTSGHDSVLTVQSIIAELQKENGSWYDNPYITVLAAKVLGEKPESNNAKISDIKIFKKVNGSNVESSTFNAFEELATEVISEYNKSLAGLVQSIVDSNGNVVYSQKGDVLNWKIKNDVPGVYTVIAQIKDNINGKVIDSYEKTFEISPSFEINDIVVSANPQSTDVNNPVKVDIESTFNYEANINKQLKVKLMIYDTNQNPIGGYEGLLDFMASQQVMTLEITGFEPDVTAKKDYIIKTEVFESDSKIMEGQTVFKVLGSSSVVRIDAQQSLDKKALYQGKDSVTLSYKLFGEENDGLVKNISVETTIPADGLKVKEDAIDPKPSSITTDEQGNVTISWNFDSMATSEEKNIDITLEGENLLPDAVVQLTKNTKITYYDSNDTPMEINLPGLSMGVNKYEMDIKIKTDKKQYNMNENMEIIVEVKNLISHSCILVRKIEVIDDKDNVIEVIEQNRDIQWEPEEALTHKFGWNTENNIAGKYNVRVTLGQQNKIIFSQVGSFEILGTDVTGYGITGALKVLTKEVDPSEDVDIKAELSNSGNADIIGAKSILSIIDSSKDEVIDTVVVDINLELGGYKSKNVTWKHDELESGEYQVKYQLELPNKKVIDLGSDSFTVIEKSIEPTPTPSIEPTDTGEDDDKPTSTPTPTPGGNGSGGSGQSSGGGNGSGNVVVEPGNKDPDPTPTPDDKDPGKEVVEPDDKIPGALPVDLAVSISSDRSTYAKGQIITYKIRFKNMLDTPTGEFEVIAQIPGYTSIKDSGEGEVNEGNIVWKIPDLSSKGEEERVYTVLVNDFEEPEVIVSNTARIAGTGQFINPEDDSSNIMVMLRSDENGEVLHRAYINGYPDNTFRPENQVTRAEVAAMFAKILNLEVKKETQAVYSDVPKEHWAAGVIRAVTDAGLFKGYEDNTFRPDAAITRAELVVVIAKHLKLENVEPFEIYFSDIEGHWAMNYIEEINRFNITKGYEDGTFRPNDKIKRSEAVTLINKMLYRGPLKADRSSFTDVGVNHWAFGHIEEAARDHTLKLDEEGLEIYQAYLKGVEDVE